MARSWGDHVFNFVQTPFNRISIWQGPSNIGRWSVMPDYRIVASLGCNAGMSSRAPWSRAIF